MKREQKKTRIKEKPFGKLYKRTYSQYLVHTYGSESPEIEEEKLYSFQFFRFFTLLSIRCSDMLLIHFTFKRFSGIFNYFQINIHSIGTRFESFDCDGCSPIIRFRVNDCHIQFHSVICSKKTTIVFHCASFECIKNVETIVKNISSQLRAQNLHEKSSTLRTISFHKINVSRALNVCNILNMLIIHTIERSSKNKTLFSLSHCTFVRRNCTQTLLALTQQKIWSKLCTL